MLGMNEVPNQTGPIRQRVELHSKSSNCDMELFAFYILVRTQIADILEVYGAFLCTSSQQTNTLETLQGLMLHIFQDVIKCFPRFFQGRRSNLLENSRTRVAGLGSITLRTLLVLQASHGEAGPRVNLLACIAVVGQRPHICKKSDVEEGKGGMLFLQLSRVQRS